jgi:hypothetical protein
MLFLKICMTNLVLTKSSDPKAHAFFAFTVNIFAGFCVSYRSQWRGGRGEAELIGLYHRTLKGQIGFRQHFSAFGSHLSLVGVVSPTNPVREFALTRDA